MPPQWIHVTPRTAPAAPQFCLRCEDRIVERWTEAGRLCSKCAFEHELFNREARHDG